MNKLLQKKQSKKFRIFFLLALVFFQEVIFPETITFSSDSMSGVSGKKSDRTTLIGHAKIKTESMEISADKIELYGTDFRFMAASGNIQGYSAESKLSFKCQSLTYDRIKKTVVMTDEVHLEDKENNVTAEAQLIEYNQKTEIAVMQIDVYIVKEKNTCTSAHALYYKKEQILNMRGNPQVVQDKDAFRAQEISLNLKTNAITLDGHVRGSVDSESSSSGKK